MKRIIQLIAIERAPSVSLSQESSPRILALGEDGLIWCLTDPQGGVPQSEDWDFISAPFGYEGDDSADEIAALLVPPKP